jgi:hypothetical protein
LRIGIALKVVAVEVIWKANEHDGTNQVRVDVGGLVVNAAETGKRHPGRA